jgi:RNA polymerase-binding transcription factor DksA
MDFVTALARLHQAELTVLSERSSIAANLADAEAVSVDTVGAEPMGWSDSAGATFDREIDAGLIDELNWSLHEIAAARERVTAKTYGLCEDCGRAISDERLSAVPATRFCIEHAADRERPFGVLDV